MKRLLFVVALCSFVFMPVEAMAVKTVTSDQEKPEAVEKLISESLDTPKIRLFDRGTKVRELIGRYSIEIKGSAEDALLGFLEKHREAFGIDEPRRDLVMTGTEMDFTDEKYIFQQTYEGFGIWGNTVEMELNPERELVVVVNRTGPVKPDTLEPGIKRQAALSEAAAEWKKQRGEDMPPAASELLIYNGALAYDVKVPVGMLLYHFFIDASDGKFLHIERINRGKSKNCH